MTNSTMSAGYSKEQLQEKLFDEMMKGMVLTLSFGLLVTFIIAYVMYELTPSYWVIVWFFANLLTLALRFQTLRLYLSKKASTKKLIARTYVLALISGVVWACLVFFYDPSNPLTLQLMLLMILGGMPLTSLSTHGNMLMVYLLFSFPNLFALNYWALFETPQYSLMFFIMTLVYSFLVYSAAYRFYQRIKESFLTNMQNAELVDALRERQTQLESLAYVDSLTELSNRRYFTVSAELALETIFHKNARLFLFLVDADKFKSINDQYGHESGDAVLKHIADCLKASAKRFNQNPFFEQGQVAEAARLGGDEFIISYVVLDEEFDVESITKPLLSAIHQQIDVKGKTIHPQASIGVSEAPRQAQDVSSLLRLADKAMYRAKKLGGDQVFYCTSTDLPPLE